MRKRSFVAFGLGALAAAGCVSVVAANLPPATFGLPALPDKVPWTGTAPLRADDEFDFVVVTDRTGDHRDGVFEEEMPPKVNLVRPEFVVSVGDLIEGYTDDRAQLSKEWDEIETAVGKLAMPFFYVPGNHDMSNAVMAEVWQSRFGPSYYHFTYKGVLFLALNSELFGLVHDPKTPLPGPWKQAEQMEYVERVLRENANARWTFVLVHQPLWDVPKVQAQGSAAPPMPQINADWLKVEELLGDRPYTVFAGHYHRYTLHTRNDRQFITLATTGGGSELRGTPFGEFDHVAHVTLTKDGPVIANLRLDGILPSDVVTEEQRALVLSLARAIQAEPFTGDARAFSTGTARFSVANSGRRPLTVRGRFVGNAQLEADAKPLVATVAPGQVASLELPVRTKSAHAYATLAPARVEWTLATTAPDGAPLEVAAESVVMPEAPFSLARTAGTITVDGDLADWGPLAFDVREPAEIKGHGTHRGPADASFRFDARQDADALYVAVQVRDDSIVASRDRIAREQDHVTLHLDVRPDPARSKNMDYFVARRSGETAQVINVWVTLKQPKPDPILDLFSGGTPPGIRTAARRTSDGYVAEIAVPEALLDERRGGTWDAARINLTVTDFDAAEKDHTELSWRPSRYGVNAVAGSGTFVRQ